MRLATFNIMHGRSPEDGRVDLDRFRAAIETLDADVLALQEVDRDQPRSLGVDLTAVAAEVMHAPAHRFAAALTGTPGEQWQAATGEEQPGTSAYGIALLSRLPVSDWTVVRLPALRPPVPHWNGGRRPVIVRDEARVGLVASVRTPTRPITVATTHLSFIRGWNTTQLRRLLRVVRRRAAPHVVMGDLNMGLRTAIRVTRLRPLAVGQTYPADRPDRQLDHVLADGVVAAGRGRSVRLGFSDHRALVVEFTLPS